MSVVLKNMSEVFLFTFILSVPLGNITHVPLIPAKKIKKEEEGGGRKG